MKAFSLILTYFRLAGLDDYLKNWASKAYLSLL